MKQPPDPDGSFGWFHTPFYSLPFFCAVVIVPRPIRDALCSPSFIELGHVVRPSSEIEAIADDVAMAAATVGPSRPTFFAVARALIRLDSRLLRYSYGLQVQICNVTRDRGLSMSTTAPPEHTSNDHRRPTKHGQESKIRPTANIAGLRHRDVQINPLLRSPLFHFFDFFPCLVESLQAYMNGSNIMENYIQYLDGDGHVRFVACVYSLIDDQCHLIFHLSLASAVVSFPSWNEREYGWRVPFPLTEFFLCCAIISFGLRGYTVMFTAGVFHVFCPFQRRLACSQTRPFVHGFVMVILLVYSFWVLPSTIADSQCTGSLTKLAIIICSVYYPWCSNMLPWVICLLYLAFYFPNSVNVIGYACLHYLFLSLNHYPPLQLCIIWMLCTTWMLFLLPTILALHFPVIITLLLCLRLWPAYYSFFLSSILNHVRYVIPGLLFVWIALFSTWLHRSQFYQWGWSWVSTTQAQASHPLPGWRQPTLPMPKIRGPLHATGNYPPRRLELCANLSLSVTLDDENSIFSLLPESLWFLLLKIMGFPIADYLLNYSIPLNYGLSLLLTCTTHLSMFECRTPSSFPSPPAFPTTGI